VREQGLQAFALRNKIKAQARALMSDRAAVATLEPESTLKGEVRKRYRNHHLSGDPLWQAIVGSSTRTNPAVDAQCGLSNASNNNNTNQERGYQP
jgi:hypothetical protein